MKVEKMKESRRWLSWLPKAALVALLGASIVFAGCSSDDDDDDDSGKSGPDTTTITVSDVSPSTDGLVVGGESKDFTVTASATDTDGNAVTPTYKWTASPADAVTLTGETTATVTVTGVKPADKVTLTVTVSVGTKSVEKSATVSITESPVPVTGVTLSESSVTIEKDKTVTLIATIEPSTATNKKVTWKCEPESVATVKDGVVTGVGKGNATITVTTEDGNKTAICRVTVAEKAIKYTENFEDYTKFEFVNIGTPKNVLRGTKSDESTVDVMFTAYAEAEHKTDDAGKDTQQAILEVQNDEPHNNYVCLWNSNGKGPRGAHTNQDLGLSDVADYYVEFDASISAPSYNAKSNGDKDPQFTYLTLMTNGKSTTNDTPSTDYLFMLKHDSTNEINTSNELTSTFTYSLNDADESSVSLANGSWYHFVIHVADETVTLSITDEDGVVIEDTNGVAVTDRELKVEGTSYTATSIDLNVGKGYRAFVKLDNIMTYTYTTE